jgi:hypothetical protein
LDLSLREFNQHELDFDNGLDKFPSGDIQNPFDLELDLNFPLIPDLLESPVKRDNGNIYGIVHYLLTIFIIV